MMTDDHPIAGHPVLHWIYRSHLAECRLAEIVQATARCLLELDNVLDPPVTQDDRKVMRIWDRCSQLKN